MKVNNNFKRCFKYFILFIILSQGFYSCENHRFDSDKRQIMAKNEIMSKLQKVHSFDVTSFAEDTVKISSDSNFKKQIRYTLDIVYLDSNKIQQEKRGVVMFTPDGNSIINSQITNR